MTGAAHLAFHLSATPRLRAATTPSAWRETTPEERDAFTARASSRGAGSTSTSGLCAANGQHAALVVGSTVVSFCVSYVVRLRRKRRSPQIVLKALAGEDSADGPMLAGIKGPTNAKEVEGLPWWWEAFWTLPFTKRGKQGEPLTLGDSMHVFRCNIEQIFGGYPSFDGAPLAEGDLEKAGLTDGTMYIGLQEYYKNFGSVYKLCFGPKSFLVISDAEIAKHVLRERTMTYDKGMLGEVLEDVMGKGLIPADLATWKVRRRAIVPGFHKAWLQYQVGEFARLTQRLMDDLKVASSKGEVRDMEERFGSVALDIIGYSVFNYDFESTLRESPVVRAAISSLREVEHRAQTPVSYWKLPFVDVFVEQQREFKENMALLDGKLNECVATALRDREEMDVEQLQNRDYSKVQNTSLLRFLVDMRGEETTGKQLRDDMITMLIAGHETTASALTWALFELAQNEPLWKKLQAEVDSVLGDREVPTYEDVEKLLLTRLCVAESLRMYPEPPLLIRRSLEEDVLPAGRSGINAKVLRGHDFFISIYNIHRSECYWPHANTFDPERFLRPYSNPEVPGWAGYDPAKWKGLLYPNEISADYAFLPFGGGQRKCVGDVFAMLEATVVLASVARGFDFTFAAPTARPADVGTCTGATIHTRNGLHMHVTRRGSSGMEGAQKEAAAVPA